MFNSILPSPAPTSHNLAGVGPGPEAGAGAEVEKVQERYRNGTGWVREEQAAQSCEKGAWSKSQRVKERR